MATVELHSEMQAGRIDHCQPRQKWT